MGLQEHENDLWKAAVSQCVEIEADYEPIMLQTDGLFENISDIMAAILENEKRHNLEGARLGRAINFVDDLLSLPDARATITELPIVQNGSGFMIQLSFPSSGEVNG
ncbi:hypothetical protein H0X10_02425 [Candidatus Saccharibacteria bacterium]|nr:hypothetical protein [Candidatus Saccharibacteria bacterium]